MTTSTLNPTTLNEIENRIEEISASQNLQKNSFGHSDNVKKDAYSVVTDKILELLDQGIVPWKKPWKSRYMGKPKNFVTGKEYQGINFFLLSMAQFENQNFLTFKQVRELGGTIRKGSRGLPVIYCNTIINNKKNENLEAVEKSEYFFWKYAFVFNLEQTEGIEIPVPEKIEGGITFNPIEECEKICAGFLCKPEIEHIQQMAYYSPSLDIINMPKKNSFNSPEEYYSTLFHEMTHSTGHINRLGREGVTENHSFGDALYSKEELIAEMGSAFLCNHANISSSIEINQSAYIGGWLKKIRGDKKILIQAASAAQKASNLILGL